MSCIKKIKSEEISGSTFRGREISLIGDITDYSFIAKVKSPFQGKITEIAGVKNANKVFFSYESIKDLRNGKYIIEYWGDFADLGNEPFLLEELSIVSAEKSSGNCSNETHVFDVKINNITIPISLDFSVVNIYNNSGSYSWGNIGGDIETQTDLIQKFENYYNDLIPYTGATQDVNIGAYYFKSSKGFIKTGGTPSQYLMADGSTSTLPSDLIRGTGTTNLLPKFTSSGTIANSIVYDNGTNVGIGTTSPQRALQVNAVTTPALRLNNSNSNQGIEMLTQADKYSWLIGAQYNVDGAFEITPSTAVGGTTFLTPAMAILQTGNVGIGTSTPSEKLDVEGYVKATGFKTPDNSANKALTSDGRAFDLDTKADLEGGKVPASQLPSYVDDVLEFANLASFPATGESGKIYIAIDTNLTYRWGGSSYVVMSSSLALGETSSTAYRGDRGKIAYDHSQVPHDKTLVGLGNVDNTSDVNKPISTATQNALNLKADKGLNIKVTTPTSYVTNTVSETEVYRLPLPPGTFNPVDVLKIPLMLVKKLGTNGTIQVRGKMSTSPTMPSGTTDLIFTTPVAAAGNQTLGIIKTFFIDNGNIKGTAFTNVSYTDNGTQAGVISEKPFDIDAMNYLYISVINGSANDQTRLEGFQLTNS